jgi:hypothetical protein
MARGNGLVAVRFVAVLAAVLCAAQLAGATNSVVIESKTFAPSQVACSVGVFITNDVPITGIVLPLELRSISGGAFTQVTAPTSFRFKVIPGNRLDNSPLGTGGENWPDAQRVLRYFASPMLLGHCSGPISRTYDVSASSGDGISPDAVLYATVSMGDPGIGEEWYLPPGADGGGTSTASMIFTFSVDSAGGCFRIDTCCVKPSNHLGMVEAAEIPQYVLPNFKRGIVSVGTSDCPGDIDPDQNHAPVAKCRDSLLLIVDSACTARLTDPTLVNDGSWDFEDSTNLAMMVEPSGRFIRGETDVNLVVCDQDGKCDTCRTRVFVEDTVPVTVRVNPDSVRFHYSENVPPSQLWLPLAVATTGCGVSLRVIQEDGLLIGFNEYPWSVHVNSTLAGHIANGTYRGRLIFENLRGGQRDTVVVIVDVDHQPGIPLGPECDSVCGVLLPLSGEPGTVSHVVVAAYVCSDTIEYCAAIPGGVDTSDAYGRFCIHTGGFSKVVVRATSYQLYGILSQPHCGGPLNFVYMLPWEDWGGPACCGPAPPDTVPCLTHGFVMYHDERDSLVPIPGADAQLWDSYPGGVVLIEDTTDEFGHFGAWQQPGTLVVRAGGFCPTVVEDFQCAYDAQTVLLGPVTFDPPPNWPYFTDYFSTSATFEGVPIQPGDVIYATDPQGVICGICWVTQSGQYLIHVLGDDPDTPQDEGAGAGDHVTLWLNCTCSVVAPDTWVNFGDFRFDAAWDCRPTKLCCTLCPGWNMWSYNILLPSFARPDVLATIDLNYDALRTGLCDLGSISWFEGRPVNDLNSAPPWYGYDIHMKVEDTICIEGEVIDPTTPIALCEGWNYIPYLPMEMDNMDHALQSLAGNYSHIFTMYCGFGVVSWDETRTVNDLPCLETCHGYWIKMRSDDTLIYPASGYACETGAAKIAARSATGRVLASPLVADFWSAGNAGLNAGDLLTARGPSGQMVGECVIGEGGCFLVHVYGDVANTAEIEGAESGEALTFEINGVAAQVSGQTHWYDRSNNRITVTPASSALVPTEYALLQNYPNPFNSGTIMPFVLRQETNWTLKIYNVAGQTVKTITGQDGPGRVNAAWDGADESRARLASGVYFYRLTASGFVATRKMILVK